MLMRISIEDLTFEAIIGLLEFERESVQQVRVCAKIDYEYSKENFIDYAQLCELIEENILLGEYELLEEALIALEAEIKATIPRILALELKISKPKILPNATVSLQFEKKY